MLTQKPSNKGTAPARLIAVAVAALVAAVSLIACSTETLVTVEVPVTTAPEVVVQTVVVEQTVVAEQTVVVEQTVEVQVEVEVTPTPEPIRSPFITADPASDSWPTIFDGSGNLFPKPSSFKEAPMLAAMVAAGDLPPVEGKATREPVGDPTSRRHR